MTAETKAVPGHGWHTDVSADAEPPSGSILGMEVIPEVGGDTMFCDMYAAYGALDEEWRSFIGPLQAVHSAAARHGGTYGVEADHPENTHPVVRTHPETGRKALYVNPGFTKSVVGLGDAEGSAILQFLFRHCEKPEFHCRFRWQPHSIAMWDNRCVTDYAVADYHPAVRSGYPVTLKGDRPT
ncbi:MAG: taurine dioxygenase [Candidatus Poriferisodalaceae bacterium]